MHLPLAPELPTELMTEASFFISISVGFQLTKKYDDDAFIIISSCTFIPRLTKTQKTKVFVTDFPRWD